MIKMKSIEITLLLLTQIALINAQNPFLDWRDCTKNSDCSVSTTGIVDLTCATIKGNATLDVEELYKVDGEYCIDKSYCGYVIAQNGTGP